MVSVAVAGSSGRRPKASATSGVGDVGPGSTAAAREPRPAGWAVVAPRSVSSKICRCQCSRSARSAWRTRSVWKPCPRSSAAFTAASAARGAKIPGPGAAFSLETVAGYFAASFVGKVLTPRLSFARRQRLAGLGPEPRTNLRHARVVVGESSLVKLCLEILGRGFVGHHAILRLRVVCLVFMAHRRLGAVGAACLGRLERLGQRPAAPAAVPRAPRRQGVPR